MYFLRLKSSIRSEYTWYNLKSTLVLGKLFLMALSQIWKLPRILSLRKSVSFWKTHLIYIHTHPDNVTVDNYKIVNGSFLNTNFTKAHVKHSPRWDKIFNWLTLFIEIHHNALLIITSQATYLIWKACLRNERREKIRPPLMTTKFSLIAKRCVQAERDVEGRIVDCTLLGELVFVRQLSYSTWSLL